MSNSSAFTTYVPDHHSASSHSNSNCTDMGANIYDQKVVRQVSAGQRNDLDINNIHVAGISPLVGRPFGSITATKSRPMKLADFSVLKLLGTGGSGQVFLVKDKVTSELLALKIIQKEGKAIGGILREQQIFREVSGENGLLSLEASWHDEKNFYLVMPYCPGGDLALELIRCRRFDMDRARMYAAEIVTAIESLHKNRVIHRDIKPANILFYADGHTVLADFGNSKIFGQQTGSPAFGDGDCGSLKINENSVCNDICGTPLYMAPEMLCGENYTFGVDIWGLGITLYRMLTGRMPFGGDAAITSAESGPLEFKVEDNVNPVAQDLLRGLLGKTLSTRLTLEQIKSHAFFRVVNWDQVAKREFEAPWKPYVKPTPKVARTNLPFREGRTYNHISDPFPEFTFTAPKRSIRTPVPSTKTKVIVGSKLLHLSFPTVRRFFSNALGLETPKNVLPSSSQLRPFLLSNAVTNRHNFSPQPQITPMAIVVLPSLDTCLSRHCHRVY